jgi:hypothetical protein
MFASFVGVWRGSQFVLRLKIRRHVLRGNKRDGNVRIEPNVAHILRALGSVVRGGHPCLRVFDANDGPLCRMRRCHRVEHCLWWRRRSVRAGDRLHVERSCVHVAHARVQRHARELVPVRRSGNIRLQHDERDVRRLERPERATGRQPNVRVVWRVHARGADVSRCRPALLPFEARARCALHAVGVGRVRRRRNQSRLRTELATT